MPLKTLRFTTSHVSEGWSRGARWQGPSFLASFMMQHDLEVTPCFLSQWQFYLFKRKEVSRVI